MLSLFNDKFYLIIAVIFFCIISYYLLNYQIKHVVKDELLKLKRRKTKNQHINTLKEQNQNHNTNNNIQQNHQQDDFDNQPEHQQEQDSYIDPVKHYEDNEIPNNEDNDEDNDNDENNNEDNEQNNIPDVRGTKLTPNNILQRDLIDR